MPLKLRCCQDLWLQKKTGKYQTNSKKSLVPASALTNSKLQAAHENSENRKSGKFDLRPHRASVCPHMFVCLSSSRIWSTCGFWAGRVGLIFETFLGVHFAFAWSLCWNFYIQIVSQLLSNDNICRKEIFPTVLPDQFRKMALS